MIKATLKKKKNPKKLRLGDFEYIPLPQLEGYNFALVLDLTYMVSPAVFELLQDPEVKEQVLQHIWYVDYTDIAERGNLEYHLERIKEHFKDKEKDKF